jgi:hypothetical protein
MKRIVSFSLLLIFASVTGCGKGFTAYNPAELEQDFGEGFFDDKLDTTAEDHEGGETHGELPHPDVIEEILAEEGGVSAKSTLSFAQTIWNECTQNPSGNYAEYACVQKRNISVILDTFLKQRLLQCVEQGMTAQTGPGKAKSIHINHAGVTGDPRHSPKSLHSFNRAIDVKMIRATLTDGTVRQYTYSKTGNRTFYTALRKCWGNVVHTYNGCPLYGGNPMLTGSIGWENSDHGRHMHLSVPYCLSGKYGSGIWVR